MSNHPNVKPPQILNHPNVKPPKCFLDTPLLVLAFIAKWCPTQNDSFLRAAKGPLYLSRREVTGVRQALSVAHVRRSNYSVVRTLRTDVTDDAIIMDTLEVGTFVRAACFTTAHKIGV